MNHIRVVFVALTLTVIASSPAMAQETPPATDTVTGEAELVKVMSKALLQMASAQEVFYSKHMRYAGEIDVLSAFEPVPDVTVRLVTMHPNFQGYAAEATHPALEGRNCVIFIGAEGTPGIATKREQKSNGMGRVACDSAM